MNESQISPIGCSPTLQNLFAQSTRRKKPGWATPNSSKVATEPARENTASRVGAPDPAERPAPQDGARMPATGRGRRHLSLASPGPRQPRTAARARETRPRPQRRAWGPRRALSATPEPCAERRGRGPSRGAALPRPLPGGSGQPGPSPQAVPKRRVPDARSSAAEPPRPPHGRRSGPPRDGPARGVLTEPRGRRLGPPFPLPPSPPPLLRLPGRPRWALGLGWVKGRRWARAGLRSRGGPASRQALTGPGAQGQADRGGERGCRLR